MRARRALQVDGESVLLRGLGWRVRRGEHWCVAGGNGAGKSTLSRLLAHAEVQGPRGGKSGDLSVGGAVDPRMSGTLAVLGMPILGRDAADAASTVSSSSGGCRGEIDGNTMSHASEATGSVASTSGRSPFLRSGVGWVSTELHLAMAAKGIAAGTNSLDQTIACRQQQQVTAVTTTAAAVLSSGGAADPTLCGTVARWLGLEDVLGLDHGGGGARREAVPERLFATLSQGEQKLVLVGAAISLRPQLLVLDEPCQVTLGAKHLTAL